MEGNAPVEHDLETKILGVMTQNPKGVSQKILSDSIPSVNAQELAESLNKLLVQHKVQLLQKGNQLVYKLKHLNSTQQYQGTDVEEKLIFEAIERSGNNGIIARDLKAQCHLAQAQVNKVLKGLENRKMIKCVTSTSRKKLFMLYNLEPSQSVTGGTFYSGQEFESEFVNVLADQCYRYLVQAKAAADPVFQRNASYKSSKDICDYINCLKISKVNLTLKDIENILESLIYDNKVEKCVSMSATKSSKNTGMENLYKATKPLTGSSGLMMVPCGVCPVYQDCHIGGDISPATCEYMKQWLSF